MQWQRAGRWPERCLDRRLTRRRVVGGGRLAGARSTGGVIRAGMGCRRANGAGVCESRAAGRSFTWTFAARCQTPHRLRAAAVHCFGGDLPPPRQKATAAAATSTGVSCGGRPGPPWGPVRELASQASELASLRARTALERRSRRARTALESRSLRADGRPSCASASARHRHRHARRGHAPWATAAEHLRCRPRAAPRRDGARCSRGCELAVRCNATVRVHSSSRARLTVRHVVAVAVAVAASVRPAKALRLRHCSRRGCVHLGQIPDPACMLPSASSSMLRVCLPSHVCEPVALYPASGALLRPPPSPPPTAPTFKDEKAVGMRGCFLASQPALDRDLCQPRLTAL